MDFASESQLLTKERDEFHQFRHKCARFEPVLYVSNLDPQTTAEDVRNWFSTYGAVRHCSLLPRDKLHSSNGVAFVHYYHVESGVAAIAALHAKFSDKTVTDPLCVKWEQKAEKAYQAFYVDKTSSLTYDEEKAEKNNASVSLSAKPSQSSTPSDAFLKRSVTQPRSTAPPPQQSTLPVPTLNTLPAASTTPSGLEQLLLLNAIMGNTSLASLLQPSSLTAAAALAQLGNPVLQPQPVAPPPPAPVPTQMITPAPHINANKIHIAHLRKDVTEQLLRKQFGIYGQLIEVKMTPTYNSATMVYADNLAAQNAVHNMNGNTFLGNPNEPIEVKHKSLRGPNAPRQIRK